MVVIIYANKLKYIEGIKRHLDYDTLIAENKY